MYFNTPNTLVKIFLTNKFLAQKIRQMLTNVSGTVGPVKDGPRKLNFKIMSVISVFIEENQEKCCQGKYHVGNCLLLKRKPTLKVWM